MAEVAKRRAVRPVFLLVLVVALAVPAIYFARRYFVRRAEQVAEERRLRTTALVEVAPSPLPVGLPVVGDATPGPDGYALAHVDKPAVRSLFWHRKYADLTRDFEALEDAFESDPRKEYWPIDAGDAFDTAEASLAPKLDEWVAASPDSFAPYLARATYELARAWEIRGHAYAKDTPDVDMHAMEAPVAKSAADYEHALALRPKLVAAMRGLIRTHAVYGVRSAMKDWLDRATASCPACFQIRVTYIFFLTPRWGGNYAAMDAFASSAPVALNARLRFLAGYADMDRADVARMSGDEGRASLAIERAMKLGDHWEFFLARGRVRQHRKDWSAALADFDRANELRPGMPEVLTARAWVLNNLRRSEDAGRSLLDGLRVRATDQDARDLFPYVVSALDWDGWQAHLQGKRDAALRLYDLAAELAPTQRDLIQRRAAIIVGSDHPDIAALEAAAKANPDDFRLHQQLDYSLAMKRDFPRVVAMWTEYIARHPDDASAHLERGGAYFDMHDLAHARADAAKSCELGDSEGCAHAH